MGKSVGIDMFAQFVLCQILVKHRYNSEFGDESNAGWLFEVQFGTSNINYQ